MEPGACCLNALPGDSDGLVGVVGEAQLNCSLPLGFRYGLTGWISKLTVSMKLFFQVSLWGPHLAMFLVQTRHAGQSSRKDRSGRWVQQEPQPPLPQPSVYPFPFSSCPPPRSHTLVSVLCFPPWPNPQGFFGH